MTSDARILDNIETSNLFKIVFGDFELLEFDAHSYFRNIYCCRLVKFKQV